MTIFAFISFAAAAAFAILFFTTKKSAAAVEAENKLLAEASSKANVQNASLETDLKNKAELIARAEQEIKKKEEEFTALNNELTRLKQREAALQSDVKNIELMKAQQQEAFNALQNAAKEQFKNMADSLLKQKTEELKGANKEILTPINDNLGKLQDKLAQMQNLNENLQQEASSLTKALRHNKVQGNLGEMLLEDILQNCGLKEGQHYEKQEYMKNGEGKASMPDFTINLPDGRYVLVDSKMSLTAYNQFVNETDEAKKKTYLKEHIASVEAHIKELAAKKYQELKDIKGKTPDFVIMYVPLEYAYLTALEAKNDLGLFAGANKVAIATASSIIPILKTIENLWKIMIATNKIEEIRAVGMQIHKQASNFVAEMDKLGRGLNTAQGAYVEARKKLNGQQGVVGYAKKLESMGIASSKGLEYDKDEQEESEDASGELSFEPQGNK